MKRLRLAGLFLFIVGFVAACNTTTDNISPDPVIRTASLSGDDLNTVAIDSINRVITVQIGSYSSRNPYRPTSDRLFFTASPQSFIVAQYDTSKISKPLDLADGKSGTFTTRLDLLTYSNQNPLRLRVIRNGSAGTVVTVNSGGTAYTLLVKASSPLKLDGVLAQQGLWPDNADTVRLSTTNWRYYTVTMGVSGLYNGTGPVTPTFSLVNVRTKEKTRVFAGVFAAGDLTTFYIYVNDLGNRLGTYQVLLETADGRAALSPFFIKIS